MIELLEKYKDNELTTDELQINRIIEGLNSDEFLDKKNDDLHISKNLIDAENLQEFCKCDDIRNYLMEWNNDFIIASVQMEEYKNEYIVYGCVEK